MPVTLASDLSEDVERLELQKGLLPAGLRVVRLKTHLAQTKLYIRNQHPGISWLREVSTPPALGTNWLAV